MLSAETSTGPCGPSCACAGDATTAQVLTVVPLATTDPAIACTLEHEEMGDRLHEWQTVLGSVTGRTSLDGGIRLALAPDADLAEVARLARAEQGCCSFFRFALTVDGRGTALDVRAPAEARDLVTAVFGVAA